MLNIGTATFKIFNFKMEGIEHTYEGLVNQAGEALGLGVATNVEGRRYLSGTFYKNKLHGKGKNHRSLILIYYHLL